MSEREGVKIRRYDACEMDYIAERESGDYVKYEDHMAALTTAERERDEARAAIGTLRELVGCRSRNVGDVDMPTHTREIMEAVRHRAERAERVVEAP